jgi:hypothetical protein
VLALLELARRWSRPVSPFVGAPRGMRSVTWVEPRLEAEAENNLSSDVEVYKGYQIAYQTRKGAGIVRVTAYVTAQPLPVGQPAWVVMSRLDRVRQRPAAFSIRDR